MIPKRMYHTLIMYIYISYKNEITNSCHMYQKKEEPEGSSLINYLD